MAAIQWTGIRTPALALLVAFAGDAIARSPSPEHEYRVTVKPDLSRMQVEGRYAHPVRSVRARDRDAPRYIEEPIDCGTGKPLRVRGRALQLPAGGIHCLRYSVDLDAAAAGERRNRYLAEDNIFLSPSNWLWRPSLEGGTSLVVEFELPQRIAVAVPWQPLDSARTRYRLQASPESASAPALIGRFDYREIDVGGASLRIALPNSATPLDSDATLAWIRATATDVSLTYGRFPNPSPLVVVLPVSSGRSWSRSPVPFGRVIRDGGEAVELFVDPNRPLKDYLGDWTATHEFSHLMLPYLDSNARWISEGFAQYYQNVLLARSGAYDQPTAWQKIHAGLERGRAARPELSPNAAAQERRRGARMKVYWSGAALALMADVELRRRSGGEESLDRILERLQRCCLPSDRSWSGPEFLTRLDALAGDPVFMPLYRQYADAAGFPDTSAVFASLGVAVRDGDVALRDDAELASVRERIMQKQRDVAAWRRGLATDD